MTQIDMEMFDDDLAQDITYNGATIRAFVTLGGGTNRITIRATDVPAPTAKDKVVISGNTRQIRGPADEGTNGEIHILDLMPLPGFKSRKARNVRN